MPHWCCDDPPTFRKAEDLDATSVNVSWMKPPAPGSRWTAGTAAVAEPEPAHVPPSRSGAVPGSSLRKPSARNRVVSSRDRIPLAGGPAASDGRAGGRRPSEPETVARGVKLATVVLPPARPVVPPRRLGPGRDRPGGRAGPIVDRRRHVGGRRRASRALARPGRGRGRGGAAVLRSGLPPQGQLRLVGVGRGHRVRLLCGRQAWSGGTELSGVQGTLSPRPDIFESRADRMRRTCSGAPRRREAGRPVALQATGAWKRHGSGRANGDLSPKWPRAQHVGDRPADRDVVDVAPGWSMARTAARARPASRR